MGQPKRKSEIVIEELGGETLLYHPENRAVHVLNDTAKLIWDLCDGAHTVAEIERSIRDAFSVPETEDVQQDVLNTLALFNAKGLLCPK